ncbi:hypothetical protein CLCR_08269 [Cladophialophora carrionii]|uniref:PNPLA domain-containing protein n=1 Tax=Cladophialophora carrionii TaxID=86049 RepID=A0A1C1CUC2_9EURO|nr:hypothetical protein CLCR_08269 [Cladophialophora carrionii]
MEQIGQASPSSEGDSNAPTLAGPTSRTPSHGLRVYPLTGYLHNDEEKDGPWAGKIILSLDGGGIRGYSSLLIVEDLMSKIAALEQDTSWIDENIKATYQLYDEDVKNVRCSADYPWKGQNITVRDERFYPAHYFDYMAGTSTGGWAPSDLLNCSEPQADASQAQRNNEAKEQYTRFGDNVFGQSRWFHMRSVLWYPRPKYAAIKVRQTILEVVRLGLRDPSIVDYEVQRETLAMDPRRVGGGTEGPFVHRSFLNESSPYNRGSASKMPIWQAAMATTAAPVFFERQHDGNDAYIDGGLGFNNPAKIAYKDVSDRHALPPKIVISIGTGEKASRPVMPRRNQLGDIMGSSDDRRQRLKKLVELVFKHSKNWLTDVDEVVDDMGFMANMFKFKFTRLSVPNDIRPGGHCLGEIPLDDWRPKDGGRTTLERLENLTNTYLAQAETRGMLEECARELVLLRRQRARTERWETYAMDVTYRCCADENCHPGPYLKNRRSMRRHFDEKHGELTRDKSPREMENILNTCRVVKDETGGARDGSASRRPPRQGTNGIAR